jgi:hypothetical protein
MNLAILTLLAANAIRPGGDMRDVSMRPPSGPATAGPTLTIDAMPYERTVVCGEYIEVTGTSTGSGAVSWSASPSGDSGSCTGTDSWACLVSVSPDDVGEGVETITVSRGSASDDVTIGFYVAGSHSCFLAQDTDGDYNATMADLDPVATWSNSGTSGLDVTQGTGTAQPTFRTGIVDGQPVVRCDGGDNVAASTASDWTFLSDGTSVTAGGVFLLSALPSVSTLIATRSGSSTSSKGVDIHVGESGGTSGILAFRLSDGSAITLSVNSSAVTTFAGKFHSFATTLDSTTPNVSQVINSSTAVTASGTFATGNPVFPLTLCADGAGGRRLTGDVFRVVIYQSALSSTQRGINQAVDEWALGGTLPVTP